MTNEALTQAIVTAGDRLADATEAELALEDVRPLIKLEAILRLVGTTNVASGKPHSASSAEAAVETDAEYAFHRERQRAATVARIKARAYYEATIARARLAAEGVAA